MNEKLAGKIHDLNEWVIHAFEDSYNPDILNSARKSAEAVCKAVILKRFDEELGSDIIDNIRKRDASRTGHSNPRMLELEQLIINVTNADEPTTISNKQQRSQILSYLRLIQAKGNTGSHDFDTKKNKVKLTTIKLIRFTLIELVVWFYEEFLEQSIPKEIEIYITESKENYIENGEEAEVQDLRGLEIVKLAYPKKKVIFAQPDYNSDGIGYEFVAVEIARNNIIGHLLVKSKISLAKTLRHFLGEILNSLTFSLSTLQICTPRIINLEKGTETKRRELLEKEFKKIVLEQGLDTSLIENLIVDYIDDFVWNNCLYDNSSYETDTHYSYEDTENDYFLDQELFLVEKDGDSQKHKLSLEYLKDVLSSSETKYPVTAIVGQAGIGKTTFCDQAISLINSYPKKRSLLISSEDFQGVLPRSKVRSISDLYELISTKVHNDNPSAILETNNLEINISCGNIVLIIDGIDEIESLLGTQFELDSFLESTASLNRSYRRCLIIITSRDYHLDSYLENPSMQTFKLLGFNEESVENYLSEKRGLTPIQIRKTRKYLQEFETEHNSRYIPLYLSLICDLLEAEEISEEIIDYEIQESKYFYNVIPFDNLMYKLIRRELVRQKIESEIDCDQYIDVLLRMLLQHKGEVYKDTFNNYIDLSFPKGLSEQEYSNRRNPFYVSPFLATTRNGEKFKLKYDFLSMWLLSRLFLYQYSKHEHDEQQLKIEFVKQLSDLYDGSSLLLGELRELQKLIKLNDLTCGKNILTKLLNEYVFHGENTDILIYRKAISGLLYFCLSQIDDMTSSGYTKALVELFGGIKIDSMCVFGNFFPLNFREIEIHDGWVERYGNFQKSKFPEKAVFYDTTFKETEPPLGLKHVERLFVNCFLNKEMEIAIDVSKSSIGQIQKRVREDLSQIFKVAFKRQAFRWKSEFIYKEETSLQYGDLKKYLNFLVLKGVFLKTPNKYSGPDGYEVSSNYRESVKTLAQSGSSKPQMKVIIKEALASLYGFGE